MAIPPIIQLGIMDYEKALERQHQQSQLVVEHPDQEAIFVLEHPSVITVGYNKSIQHEVKWSLETLKEQDISIYQSDRGGAATLHSEGQLVCYPILNLRQRKWGVRFYVSWLEQLILRFLSTYSLNGQLDQARPGVYIENQKIASLGIRIEMGVARHGIAINCCNHLSLFNSIAVCGEPHLAVTSIQEQIQRPISMTDYINQFIHVLKDYV